MNGMVVLVVVVPTQYSENSALAVEFYAKYKAVIHKIQERNLPDQVQRDCKFAE